MVPQPNQRHFPVGVETNKRCGMAGVSMGDTCNGFSCNGFSSITAGSMITCSVIEEKPLTAAVTALPESTVFVALGLVLFKVSSIARFCVLD